MPEGNQTAGRFRLNRAAARVRYIFSHKQEEKTMKKTMKIEGMMCGHCEAAVKKALESLDGVEEAIVSHEEGTAVVSMTNEVSDDVLTQTVEDKDYKVTEIE